ncbi:MAG: archaemetzincin family Zn-dependent metalloprotease [Melioribacteraceae bacterium]|jgi:archaemetzincin|nr:archaemetzincin family Zn-dependent metalloprotease [Melioribacteraceae bacterium]
MEIFLAPLKFYSNVLLERLVKELSNRFSSKIHVIDLKVNLDDFFSVDRRQYYSTQIIAEVIKLTDEYDGKVILLTDVDIFVPALTFVFGEAQLNGKHSILSVCRLHEEFYSGISDENLLLERTVKEALHELGHNFGLRHCIDWDCVMHSSNGVEEVDIKGNTYCRKCRTVIGDYKYY